MTEFDMQIASRTLAQEARGEPIEGQQAVAHVLKNRLAAGRWGATLASVCLWRAQFSGWYSPRGKPPVVDPNFAYACNLREDDPMLTHMRGVIADVISSTSDPTDGAMFYYSESIPAPDWVDEGQFCGKFGNQRFFRGAR